MSALSSWRSEFDLLREKFQSDGFERIVSLLQGKKFVNGKLLKGKKSVKGKLQEAG